MTTTIYDRLNRLIASDSRWSCDLACKGYPDYILFVDDTGFGKISSRGNYVLCLAGNGVLIETWKKWWTAPILIPKYPPVSLNPGNGDDIVVYAIDKINNKIDYSSKPITVHIEPENQEIMAAFSGSGEPYALVQWQKSKCAKTSVKSAMDGDICTGGKVRFIDFANGNIDIEDTVHHIADVDEILKDRGFIMNKHDPSRTAVPIKDSHIAEIRGLVANGDIALSAPIGNGSVSWDHNAHMRMSTFIAKVIAEEEKTTVSE